MTKPVIHMIGNAHIDPVWLWVWQDGLEVAQRTCRDAVNLLRRYPDYVFSRSSAAVYEWIEETDPETFKEIGRLIDEGRWNIVNGWWVQPDCNIPCGESLIRQGLYGQLYFKERFGKIARVGFNVDTFGHCGTLPQILKKSGLDYYVFHRPGIYEKTLPSDLFQWQSPDGTRVIASRIEGYGAGSVEHLVEKVKRATEYCEETGTDIMCFYGRGDHGGGPTNEMILKIRELQKDAGVPLLFSTPDAFFEAVSANAEELPVVADELQHHSRGCYTVLSMIKTMNRRLETALLNAEKFCSLASMVLGAPYPRSALRRAWQILLFHQFHDIMGGTCIKPAYDDAERALGLAKDLADSEREIATEALSSRIRTSGGEGHGLLVFNPSYCKREDPIEFEAVMDTDENLVATDEKGKKHPVQALSSREIEGRREISGVFVASLPASGYKVFWISRGSGDADTDLEVLDHGTAIRNSLVEIKVDPVTGFLSSIVMEGEEVLNGPSRPIVIRDESDTWSHGVDSFREEIGVFEMEGKPLVDAGPVRASIEVVSRFGDSRLTQKYVLHAHHPVIESSITLDWHEKHRMLKISFPVAVTNASATYEIPYGTIRRTTEGQEEPGQRWLDVSGTASDGHPLGLLLLNDSKYGFDVLDSEMRISVVRSPMYAFHKPRKAEPGKTHVFTDQGRHHVKLGLFPHGDAETPEMFDLAERLNNPAIVAFSNPHDGDLPPSQSMVSVTPGNVVLGALKLAEESDAIILRLFESKGERTEAVVKLGPLGLEFSTQLEPWEIKTLSVTRKGEVDTADMLERIQGAANP